MRLGRFCYMLEFSRRMSRSGISTTRTLISSLLTILQEEAQLPGQLESAFVALLPGKLVNDLLPRSGGVFGCVPAVLYGLSSVGSGLQQPLRRLGTND